ncbi:MAG: hypothetical protein J3K34DRAFT_403652 [Monoraphidium minutum]|nr:MAG: hypothetical protein J3K34DRAFT_403652 [Monoraphidium minutum]
MDAWRGPGAAPASGSHACPTPAAREARRLTLTLAGATAAGATKQHLEVRPFTACIAKRGGAGLRTAGNMTQRCPTMPIRAGAGRTCMLEQLLFAAEDTPICDSPGMGKGARRVVGMKARSSCELFGRVNDICLDATDQCKRCGGCCAAVGCAS